MMRLKVLCVVLFLNLYDYVRATCPDDDSDLQTWSSQWPSVGTDANITITEKTVLDEEIIEVFSLSINNKFVLKPGMDHVIKAHYIEINDGGGLHIGSEDCKFEDKAEIVLFGNKDPGYNIPGFGDKFLGVRGNGALEFHGVKTLTWTKLNETAPKFDPESGVIGSKVLDNSFSKGAVSCNFALTGELIDCKHVKLGTNNLNNENARMTDLVDFMKDFQQGTVLTFATHKNIVGNRGLETLTNYINTTIPETEFENIENTDAYVLFGIVGDSESFEEHLSKVNTTGEDSSYYYREALVSEWFQNTEVEFYIRSANYDKTGKCLVEIGALNTSYTKPTITVYDDVSSWEVGAEILITSTDYDWTQAEIFTRIESKDTTQKNKIRLNEPLKYEHFGEIYKKVDMRAEVAVLTHNILVRSEVAEDSFHGGHVKFLEGFHSVRIEGVEFTQLGEPEILGRYPTHYHMCGDLKNTTVYTTESYIRYNSYHRNIFRCITIHGTSNAKIIGNVCFDSFGHAYFLEDGAERGTYFYRNLGGGQREWKGSIELGKTGAIPTDKKPVTFWLTNPETDLTCNVAAGGDSTGFWFVYPNRPTGPSRNVSTMIDKQAMHTKIENFHYNSGHSYGSTVLMVDNIEQDDLTVSGYNKYDPKENPLDYSNSQSIYAEFYQFTGYKSIKQLVWIRGAHINMTMFSLSDSLVGSTLVSEENLQQFFQKGVIIGDSLNLGHPAEIEYDNGTKRTLDRSLPMENKFPRPRFGIRFNRGPTSLRDITFYGAENKDLYVWAAIGFHPCLMAFFHPNSDARDLQFGFSDPEEGTFVYEGEEGNEGFCSKDGDILHSFLDRDGSVSGKICRILRNIPFHVTNKCFFRPTWNMACCNLTYAMLEFKNMNNSELVTVMRTDAPYGSDSATGEASTHFYTIVNEEIEYLSYMQMPLPGDVKIVAYGVSSSRTVTLGFCVPRGSGTSIVHKYQIGSRTISLREANSYEEFKNDTTGRVYYHDATVGVVMYKLVHDKELDVDDTVCPDDECVNLKIDVNSLDEDDFDCSTRFKNTPAYVRPNKGNPVDFTSTLPATATDEPEYGVGSTYPCPVSERK